ncbi:MAG: hypothetical protein U0401_24705 [Anaerolineae bacterium]
MRKYLHINLNNHTANPKNCTAKNWSKPDVIHRQTLVEMQRAVVDPLFAR